MRREEYVVDGHRCDSRSCAKVVTPAFIAFAWRSTGTLIPAKFAVAVAQHETTFAVNEVDTEENGFVSKGWAQVSDDEAAKVGMKGANLLDPMVCAVVFSRLMQQKRNFLMAHWPITHPWMPELWGFLAIAHNEGVGDFKPTGKGALGALCRHEGAWGDPSVPAVVDAPGTYRRANAGRPIVQYGDDCITGGPRWHEVG